MKKIFALVMMAVLMISFAVAANAAVGTVVYATKIDHEPNMEEDSAFIDESWGEPAIVINSSTPNTDLVRFWREDNMNMDRNLWETNKAYLEQLQPEDNDVELYYLWDNKYFYIGVKTADVNPSGSESYWNGDGIMFYLFPLGGISLDATLPEMNEFYNANVAIYNYMATLDTTDWDHVAANAAANCASEVFVAGDGYMYAYVRIPLVNIGINPKTNLHGMELAHNFQRISSISFEDYGYAGWLFWGGFEVCHLNTVVLVDPAQGEVQVDIHTFAEESEVPESEVPETDAPETDAPEIEIPETDAPVVETEAPETEAPAVETDAPETEAPVVETEAPETEAPVVETDAPVVETEAPETDAPVVETDAPETEEPVEETHAPETDAPAVETEAPETDPVAPETNAPETQAPVVPAEPAKKGNTGLIIGIVAAVVVVGAIVGIVLGKKKK